jgi:hypothetical protein
LLLISASQTDVNGGPSHVTAYPLPSTVKKKVTLSGD